jgi:ribonuclease PH
MLRQPIGGERIVSGATRKDGRAPDQLREIAITPNYLEQPYSSVLVEFGLTKVLCAVSVEETLPRWMLSEPKEFRRGWITGEYSMLPFSSGQGRMPRERTHRSGRTQEIQRLIGRSFRSVVRLDRLGERTLWVDCDVLQADGGTRTASITGGFVALAIAIEKLARERKIDGRPWADYVAAVSVGLLDGEPLLDLTYEEDYRADTDMNVVMTESGRFVEVQGTAEEEPFGQDDLDRLLALGRKGIADLVQLQKEAFTAALDDL